jgi:hypothetical protein
MEDSNRNNNKEIIKKKKQFNYLYIRAGNHGRKFMK